MDGSHAPHDALAGWRAAGADRVDPLRFHRIEALQRRASGLDGEARSAVDAKLAALIEDYADVLARADSLRRDEAAGTPARGPLGELADLLARVTPAAAFPRADDRTAPTENGDPVANAAATTGDDSDSARAPAPRDLDAVEDFRRIWSDVRVRSQLRESLKPAPAGAGPLNSTSLVHRALALMRDTSPGYLQHFMAYVDALAGLERLTAAGQPESAPASRSASPRARAPASRRRRGA